MKQIPIYYTDGGTANNGQIGKQRSVICVTNEIGVELIFEEIGDKTNNEAELTAILKCIKLNDKPKIIISDSQLAVKLVKKHYHTRIPRLLTILNQIHEDKSFLNIKWKPRELNKAGWIIEQRLNL
jgi:ribonuclease HI